MMGMSAHTCGRSAPCLRQRRRCLSAQGAHRARGRLTCGAAFTLIDADGASTAYDKETVIVGTASTADVRVAGPHVAAKHAQLTQKGGRMLCMALQGVEDDLTSSTYCWVNGNEIRKGVPYILASGTKLAFGSAADNMLEVNYEEPGGAAGGNAMVETLLRGMAAGASDDVRRQIEGTLEK